MRWFWGFREQASWRHSFSHNLCSLCCRRAGKIAVSPLQTLPPKDHPADFQPISPDLYHICILAITCFKAWFKFAHSAFFKALHSTYILKPSLQNLLFDSSTGYLAWQLLVWNIYSGYYGQLPPALITFFFEIVFFLIFVSPLFFGKLHIAKLYYR